GFFVNTLVMRGDVSGDPSFRTLVRRVRGAALGAYTHQDLPFERLVDELKVKRTLRYSPLFQAMFTLQEGRARSLELGGARIREVGGDAEIAHFDLSLTVAADGDRASAGLAYRADLFEAATIERMAGHLGALLDAAVADPDRPLSQLEIRGAAEHALLLAWNATDRPYPRAAT
ncbi:MAG: condensation domain-containing protein, partial [Trueperaceae bacterium]